MALGCGNMPETDRAIAAAADGLFPTEDPPPDLYNSWQVKDAALSKKNLGGTVKVRLNDNHTLQFTADSGKTFGVVYFAKAYKITGPKGAKGGLLYLGPSIQAAYDTYEWTLADGALTLDYHTAGPVQLTKVDDKQPWTGAPAGAVCGVAKVTGDIPEGADPTATFLSCAKGLTCSGPTPKADAKIFDDLARSPTYGQFAETMRFDLSGVKTCAKP
jgi:hypothetical protein